MGVTGRGNEARRELTTRAVSFDAAGTLVHPVEPVGALYAMVASRHGVAVDAAELQRRFRVAFASASPLAFPAMPAAELRVREKQWWHAVVTRVFDGIPFADFTAYFDDLFAFFASPAAWRLDPDAVALLRTLRARGLTILVVSNFDARVRGIMEALGVSPLVDRITLSSEAGAAKPDPAIFRSALTAAGLDAARVVHVGDTVREDLRGARAAGMRVILVGNAELRREAPDATVVARLGEVADHLDAAR